MSTFSVQRFSVQAVPERTIDVMCVVDVLCCGALWAGQARGVVDSGSV